MVSTPLRPRPTLRRLTPGDRRSFLQADVQPGNERSLELLRATGWREEGYARRYLKIGGRWRDHVLFSILAEDVYASVPGRRPVYDRRRPGTRPSDAAQPPDG